MDSSYHYDAMRRAIDLIDSAEAPLTLEGLAEQMDMSPAHFQRLFSAWVGISPKRYQQYLQLGQAKKMLAERMTTLAVADEVGLSGSSRLHDLFVRWEAMSPGDFARGGEGLVIRRPGSKYRPGRAGDVVKVKRLVADIDRWQG